MLTVKDLIEALCQLPDDLPVIMQKDGEGNSYSPLEGVDGSKGIVYVAESTWSGAVYTEDDIEYLKEEDDEDHSKNPRCVVLYPVN